MRTIDIRAQVVEHDFAIRAADRFAEHPELATFATGNPAAGELLALRWGLGDDCVLVVRIDPDYEPTLYPQIIGRKAP